MNRPDLDTRSTSPERGSRNAAWTVPDPAVPTLSWQGDARSGHLRLLDQTRLPGREVQLERTDWEDVAQDIHRLAVRGAPAIGVAAAYALVLAARPLAALPADAAFARLEEIGARLGAVRPTAVQLSASVRSALTAASGVDAPDLADALLVHARRLHDYERDASAAIGRHGASRLDGSERLLTHCNAGALATVGLGTALAPIYVLHASGRRVHVWVDETRPLLQGRRLTTHELAAAGVPHAVLVDGAAASLMASGRVDAVIVGADRIAANGDVANKIGTYAVAVAASHHGIPFFVAAPGSTFDAALASGADIPIEERPADPDLLLEALGGPSPAVYAPAFDVTPAALVTGYITEHGVLDAPRGAGSWGIGPHGPFLQPGPDRSR